MDRFGRFCCGGDNNGIDAAAAGEGLGGSDGILAAGWIHDLGAKAGRQFQLARIEIDAENTAAVSAQELNGDEADEAKAGDDDEFAQRRLHKADALERDGTDYGEGCMIVRDAIRNEGAEILRDSDDFGMGTVRDDAIADGPTRCSCPDFEDDTRVGITEWERLIEFGADRVEGGGDTVGPHLFEDLADLIGLRAGFLDPSSAAELDEHALGAGGDEGGAGTGDEGATRR